MLHPTPKYGSQMTVGVDKGKDHFRMFQMHWFNDQLYYLLCTHYMYDVYLVYIDIL